MYDHIPQYQTWKTARAAYQPYLEALQHAEKELETIKKALSQREAIYGSAYEAWVSASFIIILP